MGGWAAEAGARRGASPRPTSMASTMPSIHTLIATLEKIARECGERPAQSAEVAKDEFLRLKSHMYSLLTEVRESVLQRQALLNKRGHCHETIERGHIVRKQLDELKKSLPRLQEIHKKAQQKRGAKKTAAKKEELNMRYQDIRNLKRRVDEVTQLFHGESLRAHDGPGGALRDAAGGAGGAPAATLFGRPEADARRDCGPLSEEDRGEIDRLRARDKTNDQTVEEIGGVLNRMAPMVGHIGQVAEHQRKKADNLSTDIEKAQTDLGEMNKRISEVIRYEKNTNLCCQLLLGLVFMCCVGFIFQQLNP